MLAASYAGHRPQRRRPTGLAERIRTIYTDLTTPSGARRQTRSTSTDSPRIVVPGWSHGRFWPRGSPCAVPHALVGPVTR